jgi:hypothetical protein
MSDADREEIWKAICDRQRLACTTASASIADRARNELLAFENSAVPATAHELNLRRVEATRMSASWRAESSSLEAAPSFA